MTLPKFMPTAMPFLTASDFSRPKALDIDPEALRRILGRLAA